MKKTYLILFVLITAITAQAQKVELKTNPFGVIMGAYNVTAEFQLQDYPSTTVLASAWYNTPDFKDWMYTDRDGGLSVGIRKYHNRYEDKGVFLGVASRYIPMTYKQNSTDILSLGFTVGYKYIYNEKITIDAFIGGGRIVWEEVRDSYWAPAEFISGFNFGYRF